MYQGTDFITNKYGNWKVWDHGYVEAYFNGFAKSLLLTRAA